MTLFTIEELKNIRALFFRVDLKGTEAVVVGELISKLNTMIPTEKVEEKEDNKK